MTRTITVAVNGTPHTIQVEPEQNLLGVLRDDLQLIGAKYGCGEAQCGACIVLVNGKRTPSCTAPLGEVAGKAITTIEGLAQGDKLHPVQEAFLEMNALQCGYCTPGMIMASVDLLQTNPNPSAGEIAAALETNLCRCGAHPRIIAAVRRAAKIMNGGGA